MHWLVIPAVALPCAVITLLGLKVMLETRRLIRIDRGELLEPDLWPKLSIVIAASNEAGAIEGALGSLLDVDYPDLEIIVVDDRSTDRTGEIILRLASDDSRIKPVRVDVLPDGWLGKVNALQQGFQRATGEFVLFTDADVHFEGTILKRSIRHALDGGVDHLVVLADPYPDRFWVDVAISAFFVALMVFVRVRDIESDRQDAFIGSGAFNLVRRETFERTPGFEWLRMEIADDIGVGLMMKMVHAKQRLVLSGGLVSLHWYTSVGDLVRGLEKNSFPVTARYSWKRFLLLAVLSLWGYVAPFASFVPCGIPWLWLAGATVFAANTVMSLTLFRRVGLRFLPSLFIPFGQFIMFWALVRSAYAFWRTQGVTWRGTFYPVAMLREGIRVKLP
jgi:cellulose synthase/poly-beta-1,6-N-acetylglucosamine synthase-like glycosyltransferase